MQQFDYHIGSIYTNRPSFLNIFKSSQTIFPLYSPNNPVVFRVLKILTWQTFLNSRRNFIAPQCLNMILKFERRRPSGVSCLAADYVTLLLIFANCYCVPSSSSMFVFNTEIVDPRRW